MAPKIPLRKLGKDGPSVAPLGFGLISLSTAYGTVPSDEERFEILDRAVELGATFWDSADQYGDSEELLGKWFKRTGKRDQIFLATKFGFLPNFRGVDSSAAYCKEACEKSLKALGVDFIDLYYLHHANADTPIEETMRALAELKAEGKIKHIGLSENEYSAFVLDIESSAGYDLLATCRELGISVVAFSPLGRGLLTTTFGSGQYEPDKGDIRQGAFPRFSTENRNANVKVVSQFKELAEKKGCTTSQLALAWLLKQGDDIIPTPGTKKIKYLEENWNAVHVQLTDEDEAEIRNFVETAGLVGHRNPTRVADSIVDTREES